MLIMIVYNYICVLLNGTTGFTLALRFVHFVKRDIFLQDIEYEGKHVNVNLIDNLLFEGLKTLVIIFDGVFIPK